MDQVEITAAVFLDLGKAFDSVCHDSLLEKLARIGMKGNTMKWFYTYLVGRSQNVYTETSQSDDLPFKSGVLQRSVRPQSSGTAFVY